MKHKRKPLRFVTSKGDDLYLFGIQYLLHAINRQRAITITQWEQDDIIPIKCNIYIKSENGIPTRYYTERTIEKMRRLFKSGPKQRKMSQYRKERIKEIFEDQRIDFHGAKFISSGEPSEKVKVEKQRHVPEDRLFVPEEETSDGFGDEEDYSIK